MTDSELLAEVEAFAKRARTPEDFAALVEVDAIVWDVLAHERSMHSMEARCAIT